MNILLQKDIFDEVTRPTGVFESANLLAISHGYYAQHHGRHLNLCKNCLSLYDSYTLKLINHFGHCRYSINHVDFHPQKPLLLVATGNYDGGYCYEGEIFLWDYSTGQYQSLLVDPREATHCRFTGDFLEFTLSPPDDSAEETDEFVSEVFRVPSTAPFPVSLEHCEKIKEIPYQSTPYSPGKVQEILAKLQDYASQRGKSYTPAFMAWDVAFINSTTVAVALGSGAVDIWNLKTQSCESLPITPTGACVQLFYDQQRDLLTVHASDRTPGHADKNSQIYQMELGSKTPRLVFSGNLILSKNQDGLFLGRQTNYRKNRDKDTLFSPVFAPIWQKSLGHYDIFNHALRIDGQENFYALLGNPREQHQHKSLVEIAPASGAALQSIPLDTADKHYMNICAALTGHIFIIAAEIYNSSPYTRQYTVFGMDKMTEKRLWERPLPGQATAICPLQNHGQAAISMTNGEIWIVDCHSGKTVNKINKGNPHSVPLSLAVHENTLAIGYVDGTVELSIL